MRKEYNWLNILNDIYTDVRDCWRCTQNKPPSKQWSALQQYAVNGTLKFVVVYILGPSPKVFSGNLVVSVIMYCYSKNTRALSTSGMTRLHIASSFMSSWLIFFGIPRQVLTYHGSQLIRKFLKTMGAFFIVIHLTIETYLLQATQHGECFSNTINAKLPQ